MYDFGNGIHFEWKLDLIRVISIYNSDLMLFHMIWSLENNFLESRSVEKVW